MKDLADEFAVLISERRQLEIYIEHIMKTGREDAEDIAQETLLAVWLGLDSFKREKAVLRTWAFGIAKRKIGDTIRKRLGRGGPRRRRYRLSLALHKMRPVHFDLDFLVTKWDCDLVLSRLLEKEADLLTKYFIDGYTYRELAKQMGCTFKTVGRELDRITNECKRITQGRQTSWEKKCSY